MEGTFEAKLQIIRDELGCTELPNDAKGPFVEQPLGAHAESNGSHEICPPGYKRVSSESARARGSRARRSMATRCHTVAPMPRASSPALKEDMSWASVMV